jgi:hypothetical protein
MTADTAELIFKYRIEDGGAVIEKFLSVAELERYLDLPSRVIKDEAAAPRRTLVLEKIDGYPIVKITTAAFTPDEEDEDTDISILVATIKLPLALKTLENNAFFGTTDIVLNIPESVRDALGDDVMDELESDPGITIEVVPDELPGPDNKPLELDSKYYGKYEWIRELEGMDGLETTVLYVEITRERYITGLNGKLESCPYIVASRNSIFIDEDNNGQFDGIIDTPISFVLSNNDNTITVHMFGASITLDRL